MTADERDELMRFLRELSISREPVDAGARELIANAMAQNPNVGYRLVQQVMGLRMALAAAQAASGSAPNPAAAGPASQPATEGAWRSGLVKTALAAGLGAAAGVVLADEASSWLDAGASDLDASDWA